MHQLVKKKLIIIKMYVREKKFVESLVYAKPLVGPDSVPGLIYNKIFEIYSRIIGKIVGALYQLICF